MAQGGGASQSPRSVHGGCVRGGVRPGEPTLVSFRPCLVGVRRGDILRCYLRAGPLATPCPERRAALGRRARGECPPGSGGQALSPGRPGRGGAGYRHRLARGKGASDAAVTGPNQLPRVMRLRDVVLFNISAIVGLRWLTTAASQFGLASLGLWLLAMVVFFLPSAIAVRELADIDPGAGGIYRWVRRAFGPLHGFVAGGGDWGNNLFFFPSLLVPTAAIAPFPGGPRFVHLGEDNAFIALVSLAGLWLAVGMNVVGLRVGKRLQNLGGHGTWLPGLIFVVLAIWSLTTHGSATPFTARGLLPASLDLQSINLVATMTFPFAGLELAPTLGDEIHDPARTLRRGIVVSC